MDVKKIFEITIWHIVILVWVVALLAYYFDINIVNLLVFSVAAILAVLMVAQMMQGGKEGA